MRTTCPHEDGVICPHPRPQGQLQYTVLVLVLVLIALKVLVLILKDKWTVLVPSLSKTMYRGILSGYLSDLATNIPIIQGYFIYFIYF